VLVIPEADNKSLFSSLIVAYLWATIGGLEVLLPLSIFKSGFDEYLIKDGLAFGLELGLLFGVLLGVAINSRLSLLIPRKTFPSVSVISYLGI